MLVASLGTDARAADYQSLSVVKPVVACEQLSKAELGQAVGAAVAIQSAAVRDTDKGKFCKVTGTIAPAVGFEVDLPIDRWTQRYFQAGCGGLCGDINASIEKAGGCLPALNGEFVVAADNMGHSGGMGPGSGPLGAFGADPDARIDFAYRGNHETTLAAKALIRAFYGQPQKYAYFIGCSDGGREALVEAERFPTDFDGIAAGAPVLAFSMENSFFHAWEAPANRRADGTPILLRSRVGLIHDAVVAHCPTLSGLQDGLLEHPFSCRFDTAWVQCPAGKSDTTSCLTAEETAVLKKLYDGPTDSAGHQFTFNGYALGSEPQWNLPKDAADRDGGFSAAMASANIKYLFMPAVLSDQELAGFTFNEDWFKRINAIGATLYNAGNTNLGPFQAHGGKLILWHGLGDDSMPPATTVAFYQGVQKLLGTEMTNSFARLFLLPGVGHCGGGQGFPQIDLLSPLMAWTEAKQAPQQILTGRTAGPQRGPGGPGPRPPSHPYAQPDGPTVATRPVYPFPFVAKYKGSGDPNDAANFEPVKAPGPLPVEFDSAENRIIGPDNQKTYHAEHGVVVADTLR